MCLVFRGEAGRRGGEMGDIKEKRANHSTDHCKRKSLGLFCYPWQKKAQMQILRFIFKTPDDKNAQKGSSIWPIRYKNRAVSQKQHGKWTPADQQGQQAEDATSKLDLPQYVLVYDSLRGTLTFGMVWRKPANSAVVRSRVRKTSLSGFSVAPPQGWTDGATSEVTSRHCGGAVVRRVGPASLLHNCRQRECSVVSSGWV